MKEEIKKQLGISDENIKYGISEMQEDRIYWFATVQINVNALPEDKKENFIKIIKDIILPKPPTNVEKVKPKTGFFNNMKKFFGM
jgi:hypothetical protein